MRGICDNTVQRASARFSVVEPIEHEKPNLAPSLDGLGLQTITDPLGGSSVSTEVVCPLTTRDFARIEAGISRQRNAGVCNEGARRATGRSNAR